MLIDLPEAQRLVSANVKPLATNVLPLAEALFRTLAEPICADTDDPPFDRSVMDGFAVRAADVATVPTKLRIVGHVAAGSETDKRLGPGEAMQINTGAPIPRAADAVVRVEHTETEGTEVSINERVVAGKFIARRATNVAAGSTVLQAGSVLTPLNVGVAATAGASLVKVYRRPTVAILATGDELVDVDRKPTGAQIRNSNEYLLRALIQAAHVEAVPLGVTGDDPVALRRSIQEGLACDMLCITGGISMGAFDCVPDVLTECGATFHFRKLAIKPGRPTIFAGMPDGTLIFALPGNPASAFVAFELLVRPALAALQGRPGDIPLSTAATLRGVLPATTNRQTYIPARATPGSNGDLEAYPLPWHGSGDSVGMAGANALIVRPPDSNPVEDAGAVSILLLDRL
ncbi:MAG: molybdopterin molybdotransferase MoeA [Planctomycetes bacterium]|nr:molybdopterin molybdotransferase MoeA [Planctomycetota bacterium]